MATQLYKVKLGVSTKGVETSHNIIDVYETRDGYRALSFDTFVPKFDINRVQYQATGALYSFERYVWTFKWGVEDAKIAMRNEIEADIKSMQQHTQLIVKAYFPEETPALAEERKNRKRKAKEIHSVAEHIHTAQCKYIHPDSCKFYTDKTHFDYTHYERKAIKALAVAEENTIIKLLKIL